MPESSAGRFELTSLVANVTRQFGASPFFKIFVHGPKKISASFVQLVLCFRLRLAFCTFPAIFFSFFFFLFVSLYCCCACVIELLLVFGDLK